MSAFAQAESDSDLMSIAGDSEFDNESLLDADHYAPAQSSTASQSAKAIQVAHESAAFDGRDPNTPLLPSGSATESREEYHEEPMLDAGPTLPDYHAATALRTRPMVETDRAPVYAVDENTRPYTDDESGDDAEPARRSLGFHPNGTNPHIGGIEQSHRMPRLSSRSFKMRVVVACLIPFIVLSGIMISSLFSSKDGRSGREDTPSNKPPADSVKRPDYLDDPYEELRHPENHYAGYRDFQFGHLEDFGLTDNTNCGARNIPHECVAAGTVTVTRVLSNETRKERSLPPGVNFLVRVGLSVFNDYRVEKFSVLDHGGQITLERPKLSVAATGKPLDWQRAATDNKWVPLNYWIYIYVKEGVELETWNTYLEWMDFEAASNLDGQSSVDERNQFDTLSPVRVNARTVNSSRWGNVNFGNWNSSDVSVRSVFGHIAGSFALQDSLSVENDAGNHWIGIVSVPGRTEMGDSDVKPMRKLSILSSSGNTTAIMIAASATGSVKNKDVSSHKESCTVDATLRAGSGSLTLNLLPEWTGVLEGTSIAGKVNMLGQTWRPVKGMVGEEVMVGRTTRGPLDDNYGQFRLHTDGGDIQVQLW